MKDYGVVSLDADLKFPSIISTHSTLALAKAALEKAQKSGYCYLICQSPCVKKGERISDVDLYTFYPNPKVKDPMICLKGYHGYLFQN